ncbi:MAG: tRNA (adenosine(37)-N6)-threonylcarbamoyltransferase complex transferase subunit TsaD, partial [Clostridia bacterium]|nr:tRNA (adenosine(37)-N6)-threonylcarbamoyltransferase complex transferase subunit TsaD [Clostridia bacterium]
VVAGGVAANSHLRARLTALCHKTGHALILPPHSLCGDNGAMIAAQGVYEYRGGHFADSAINASADDDV